MSLQLIGLELLLINRIFGCFSLQEIGTMAHKSDITDSVQRTLILTSEVDLPHPQQPEKTEDRALIMFVFSLSKRMELTISGLGVGIAAAAFARKGYEVDIVGQSAASCSKSQRLNGQKSIQSCILPQPSISIYQVILYPV